MPIIEPIMPMPIPPMPIPNMPFVGEYIEGAPHGTPMVVHWFSHEPYAP